VTAPAELLAVATEIAREAGDLARRRRSEGVAIAATKSALADIVTEADQEVEHLIRERLAAARPGDGFFGEESAPSASETGVTWVIDPIDGTVNYAAGIGNYAVSIAAVTGPVDPASWTAQAGVVYAPALGECFHATRGGGAWRGETRLRVSESSPAGALLGTGFGYDPATHAGDLATVAAVMPIARDLRRMGAAALDLSYVAAGRLDGYVERGLQPWDVAAGALLVTEAGGRLSQWEREERRRLFIAGGVSVHDEIVRLLAPKA